MSQHTELFTAVLFDGTGGDWVELHGKVFECGTYPDRAFSLSEADADAAIAAFAPVPLELEHFFSRDQRSIFDGKLGQLMALWRDGATLVGRVRVPAFVAACWREAGNKISAVWDIPSKRLVRAGLVLDPYITDAQLSAQFAAFAAQHNPKESQPMSWKDKIMEALRGVPDDFEPPATEALTPPVGVVETTLTVPAVDTAAQFAAQQQALETARAAFAAERATFARDQYWHRAETVVDRLITERRVRPAEDQPNADGQRALVALFAQALADDAGGTALFGQTGGTRFTALEAAYTTREPLAEFAGEQLPVVTLPTGPDKPPVDLDARRKELLAASPLGQRALQMQKES